MDFGGFDILKAVMVLVPMILSLTVHEFAHAAAAKYLGDDTAERAGRLNLNPVSHIDPIGTVALPMMLLLVGGGFFFGWAKPVPVNPARFNRRVTIRTGMMITAAAGPAANLVLATLCQATLAVGFHSNALGAYPEPVLALLMRMLAINVGLAIFNMIPVYPLDGQKVLVGLLKPDTAIRFERFNLRYGSLLMMGLMLFAGRIMTFPFLLTLSGLASVFGMPPLLR